MEVVVEKVSKSYDGQVYALREISLHFGPGIAGLVGPNGAGKTTFMRLLATLLKPSAGEILYDGHDIIAAPMFARRYLGYLPQDFGLYPQLTAEQFLDFLARLDGIGTRAVRQERISKALEEVHLSQYARKRLGTFSGGMRQRMGIAQALMREPALLILDEPTAGLDPAERQEFHNLLTLLGARIAILLSSHILSDIANICTHVFLIAQGQLKASGSVHDMIQSVDGKVFDCLITDEQLPALAQSTHVISSRREVDGLHARLYASGLDGLPPNARAIPPTLDDAYLILTGLNA